MRKSELTRKTKETDIKINIAFDGEGKSSINTGIPFLNHMFELFARHGFFDLDIYAKGDIEVDYHHTIEDIGIVLGDAIKKALGTKKGINRYGFFILPMDEALAVVSLDLSGRPYLAYDVKVPVESVSGIDVRLFHEFFQALVVNAGITLHIKLLAGEEAHHIFEAIFKAFSKALNQAASENPKIKDVLSTKGIL